MVLRKSKVNNVLLLTLRKSKVKKKSVWLSHLHFRYKMTQFMMVNWSSCKVSSRIKQFVMKK
jgi:hypothetical protein